MPDEPAAPGAAEPAAIPDPAAAPAAAAAPVVPAAADPAATPVAAEPAPQPASAEPAPEPKLDAHAQPTLLEQAGKTEPPPAAEEPKPGEDGPKPSEEPAPEEFKYEAPTLPEGLALDAERLTEFDGVLAPHKFPAEERQKLVDMHVGVMQRYADQLAQEQHRAWSETRKGWQDQVKGDEELGGAGHQTALRMVASARDLFVAEKDRPAFDDFLRVTGAGDHPAFLRLLYRVAQKFDEPPPAPPNPAPPPDRGVPKGGRGTFYDHPTSVARRG